MTFEIPSSVFDLHEEGVETMIQQFGSVCTLYYPPLLSACPNCYQDPDTQRSSGRYRPGGPNSFPNGSMCPYCGGAGYFETPATDTIIARCYFDVRPWLKLITDVTAPATELVTYGYLRDQDKILKCVTMSHEKINGRFGLNGDPILYGFRKNYIICKWVRSA